jgi:hypothetical protein
VEQKFGMELLLWQALQEFGMELLLFLQQQGSGMDQAGSVLHNIL